MLKKFFLSLFITFIFFIQIASGAQQDKFKGFAWSDGIGWISFNCTNTNSCASVDYGVTADSAGNLSGFAWSDTLGWLDFSYYAGTANAAKINLTTGVMSGKAMFLAGLAEPDDGWTGDLDLSQATPPTLNYTTYEVDGYAWGDVSVGWVDFKTPFGVVTYDPFYFVFTANKGLSTADRVPYNGSVVLSWTTQGGVSCSASGGVGTSWTNNNPKGSGDPTTASETVANLTSDTDFSLTCSDAGGHSITRNLTIYVNPPAPSVVIGADKTNIAYNTSTNLNWTALNVSSCTASGDWSGSKAVGSHSQSTGNLVNASNVFYITCVSNRPDIYADVSDSVQVDVEKLVFNFYPTSLLTPFNDKIKLTWNVEFANSCVASGNLPGFSGAVANSNGTHTFETQKQTTEGVSYTATLDCYGSNGQHQSKTLNLKVSKNPNYKEL